MYFYLLIIIKYILKAIYHLFICFYPLYKKKYKKTVYLKIIIIKTILYEIPRIYICILAFFLSIFSINLFIGCMVNLNYIFNFFPTHYI